MRAVQKAYRHVIGEIEALPAGRFPDSPRISVKIEKGDKQGKEGQNVECCESGCRAARRLAAGPQTPATFVCNCTHT